MIEEYQMLSNELHNAHYDAENGDLLKRAQRAIDVLNSPDINDFSHYAYRQTETKLARAESEAASIRVEFRLLKERCAELMSQHEPLNGLGIDREKVRQVLQYVQCGRLK